MKACRRLIFLFILILAPVMVAQATSVQYNVTGIVYNIYYVLVGDRVERHIDRDKPNSLTGAIYVSDINHIIENFNLNFDSESIFGTSGSLHVGQGTSDWLYLYGSGDWADWGCSLENDNQGYPIEDDLPSLRDYYKFDECESGDIPVTCIWLSQVELNRVAAPVPEPATMLLLGAGLLGLAGFRKKLKK